VIYIRYYQVNTCRERLTVKLVTVKMSDIYVNGLDKLVEIGMYPSRSEAIRVAIRDLLRRELWPADGSPINMHVETEET
jgi:metal-responsive CopG/Arc/MetJ family transcriptional regulator